MRPVPARHRQKDIPMKRRALLLTVAGALLGASLPALAATPDVSPPPAAAKPLDVDALLHDPQTPTFGNPKGDVTIVEFFDYNCGYCKRGFSELAKLLDKDSKVKLVLKELPILSKGSEEAAKVALAARLQGKYWEVHRALLESRVQANEAVALKLAEKTGVDMARLKRDMEGPEVKAELAKSREIAQKMGIQGTPHFLIGDKAIPGAPDNLFETLTAMVADVRKNGCTVC